MANKQIWKFPLEGPFVRLPIGFEPLYVAKDPRPGMIDRIALWTLVDPEAATIPVDYARIGTGQEMDEQFLERFQYVGTVILDPFVWHSWIEKVKP